MGWAVTHSDRWLPWGILWVTASTILLGLEPWVSLSQRQSSSLSSTNGLFCPESLSHPLILEGGIQNPSAGVLAWHGAPSIG